MDAFIHLRVEHLMLLDLLLMVLVERDTLLELAVHISLSGVVLHLWMQLTLDRLLLWSWMVNNVRMVCMVSLLLVVSTWESLHYLVFTLWDLH